jgi:undecaprenyl-diphosphatase
VTVFQAIIIFGAEFLIYVQVLAIAIVIWCFRKTKFPVVRFALISGLLSFLLSRLASALYNNQRPFVEEKFTPLVSHAADNGFPSDHMLLAGWLAMIVFMLDRKAGIFFWITALAIGLSRVAAGVHHVEDIVGSVAIVAVSAALSRSKFLLR